MATGEADNPRLQKATTFFNYGNDAALKSNHDYAIQMYKEACKLAPDNLKYRQALRGIARRKFGNDPTKVGRLIGARLQPMRMSARGSVKKEDFAKALATCEDAFTINPWDIETARIASDAAVGLGMKLVAQWLLESVHAQGEEHKDVEFLRHEAAIHELCEAWPKAIACWELIKKVSPTDQDATKRANDLSARATIQRSGLGEALSKSAGNSGPETLPPELEEMKRNAMTPEQRHLKDIAENPRHVGAYINLADHYRSSGRLDEAEQLLSQGMKAVPDDEYLKGIHAEVQIQRMKRAQDSLTRRLQKNSSDIEAKAKLEQVTAHLVAYEAKELRRRIVLRPDDLGLRLQLGMVLAKGGKHDEAIAEFQQARNSGPHKVQALYQAGLSFEANGATKLAERHYQDAIKALEPDDKATFNALHYRLGRISESQGSLSAAEEYYNEVAANDYSYMDVAQRLKDLNKKIVED
jgi:tetratricopeptide (TPR) repeat protein